MAEVVVKATVVIHNILTVPGDGILNEVVEQCISIFDDAFEDLPNVGNQPGQGPAAVHEYMKITLTVTMVVFHGKMKLLMHT